MKGRCTHEMKRTDQILPNSFQRLKTYYNYVKVISGSENVDKKMEKIEKIYEK